MTRWARAKNAHNHKSADAASWSQLRSGMTGTRNCTDSFVQHGASRGVSDLKRVKKNRQFNGSGFNNYTKHNRQPLPKCGGGMATEEQDINEAVAIALKKNRRRDNRRIKRQHTTKSNMVCSARTLWWWNVGLVNIDAFGYCCYCDLCLFLKHFLWFVSFKLKQETSIYTYKLVWKCLIMIFSDLFLS